ncbi:hypothetical protein LY76DRAFT_348705 [Colletotrichum caudatum]|nr:hypothetical protein LY76DRAFT_348705 [Colletotrichum caudatum]
MEIAPRVISVVALQCLLKLSIGRVYSFLFCPVEVLHFTAWLNRWQERSHTWVPSVRNDHRGIVSTSPADILYLVFVLKMEDCQISGCSRKAARKQEANPHATDPISQMYLRSPPQ